MGGHQRADVDALLRMVPLGTRWDAGAPGWAARLRARCWRPVDAGVPVALDVGVLGDKVWDAGAPGMCCIFKSGDKRWDADAPRG